VLPLTRQVVQAISEPYVIFFPWIFPKYGDW